MKIFYTPDAAFGNSPSGIGGKMLLLVRHAKSDWNSEAQTDFDRPLNARGNKNAPVMARRLIEKNINIDLFIASPAQRARQTAIHFVEAYKRQVSDIVFIDKLYLAAPAIFESVITATDNTSTTIALFAHNPGITDFANRLTNASIDDMPTCGVLGVKIMTDNWKDFLTAPKEFWFFDYPKTFIV